MEYRITWLYIDPELIGVLFVRVTGKPINDVSMSVDEFGRDLEHALLRDWTTFVLNIGVSFVMAVTTIWYIIRRKSHQIGSRSIRLSVIQVVAYLLFNAVILKGTTGRGFPPSFPCLLYLAAIYVSLVVGTLCTLMRGLRHWFLWNLTNEKMKNVVAFYANDVVSKTSLR